MATAQIFRSNVVFKAIKEYVIISFGMFLYCFSWTSFLTPNGLTGGGIPGVATIIYFATHGYISLDISYFIINTALVITGTIILGRGFGFKTIYCILLATLLFRVLPVLIPWVSDIGDNILNAILGGGIGAVGIAIIFTQGGSTGGTDIVALILAKYREISPGRVFLYCDAIIIGSIIFLPDKGLKEVVYGYLQMVSFSITMDMVLTGNKQSIQVMIFSDKYKEIADALVKEIRRGVTALDSVGWFTQEHRKLLIVVARKHQLSAINKLIKSIDSSAFISITQAMSVYGKGFEEIKGGMKIAWKKKKKDLKKSTRL